MSVIMLIIIQSILLGTAVYFLIRKPFDIGTIMVILFVVFYAFPAWDLYFGAYLFSDVIVNYRVNIMNKNEIIYLIFVTTLVMISFYLGYLITIYIPKKPNYEINKNEINTKKYRYIRKTVLLIWMVVFAYSFSRYNQSFFLFFTPSRKEGVFQSTYIASLYKLLPTTYFILQIIKDFYEQSRIKRKTLALVIFPFLAYMTTGQRREIINFFILVATILIHVKVKGRNSSESNKVNSIKYKRRKIFQLGFISTLLIPVLWWGRVVFSQLQRNSNNIIMPWHRRGFLELLFGSSSGGFKTLLLGLEHKDIFEVPWGYNIYFFIFSFIPREIMSSKPLVINRLWQIDFGLSGNPSTFYINEMYINFGITSIIISLLFGIALSFAFNKLYVSNRLIYNIYSFIIFSNVITLFKNGFIQFIISVLMAIIIIGIPSTLIMNKTKKSVVEP